MMKQCFLITMYLCYFLGCIKKPEKRQVVENQVATKVFNGVNYATKFKYKNLETFKIDTFAFGSRYNYYNRVDSLTFEQIFQGHESFLYSNEYFFYANFNDPHKIALLEESDEIGVAIWLINFDEKGNFKSKKCLEMRK
jgi:hypothetical protein